jgi:hypothetical protein
MSRRKRTTEQFDRAARILEDAFFLEQDAVLVDRLRALREMDETKESLAAASGIEDDGILSRLVDLGVTPETVAALATIPLVEVAWADGAIAPAEREVVLNHANAKGIRPGSIEHALLERWLEHKPEPRLLEAWQAYIHGLCAQLVPAERDRLKQELLHSTTATAAAAGGFLGLGSVSTAEQQRLDELLSSFRC